MPSAGAALCALGRPPRPVRVALALGEPSRLPHAGTEAQRVAALFPQGRALAGAAATLQALQALQAAAAGADLLHLACHAQFCSDNPRFSALHQHDAALTLDQAEALPLQACTVVLSACKTGLAELGSGDELVGLVRAFLVAGAARVLVSQWPVDDAVTADFMDRFYRALAWAWHLQRRCARPRRPSAQCIHTPISGPSSPCTAVGSAAPARQVRWWWTL